MENDRMHLETDGQCAEKYSNPKFNCNEWNTTIKYDSSRITYDSGRIISDSFLLCYRKPGNRNTYQKNTSNLVLCVVDLWSIIKDNHRFCTLLNVEKNHIKWSKARIGKNAYLNKKRKLKITKDN